MNFSNERENPTNAYAIKSAAKKKLFKPLSLVFYCVSLVNPYEYLFIHLLTDSLTHSLTHSLTYFDAKIEFALVALWPLML